MSTERSRQGIRDVREIPPKGTEDGEWELRTEVAERVDVPGTDAAEKETISVTIISISHGRNKWGEGRRKIQREGGERMSIVWIVVENREGGGEERRW